MANKEVKVYKTEKLIPYLFVAPQILGFILFMVIPIVYLLYLCFNDWNFTSAPKYTGLDNFKFVLSDPIFIKSIANTFVLSVSVVPLTLIISLCLALLCNKRMAGLGFYKSAFFLPMVTSTVSIAMVFYWIYAPDVGLMHFLLSFFKIQNPNWFTETFWARMAVTIMVSWLQTGYYFVIFVSGLKAISSSYYEAAEIDGANSFQKFRKITWPMLSPVTFFATVTLLIYSINVFNEPFILTGGGPDFMTYTLSMYVYHYAFQSFKYGPAAVASTVLFIILAAVTLIQFGLQRKLVNYDA